jgi:Tfp pilus assembly protein PilO
MKNTVKKVGKEKLILYGVAAFGLLIGVAGYFALVAPQKATSHRLDAEIQAAQARPAAAQQTHAPKQPSVHAADIFRLTKAMPDSNDVPGILDHLSQLAQTSSATLQSVQPSPVVPLTGGYGALPLNVVVAGPFAAVSNFLQQLRQQVALGKNGALHVDGRLLVVNDVQLATTTGSAVTATLSLDAFVYGVAPPPTTTTTTTTTTG